MGLAGLPEERVQDSTSFDINYFTPLGQLSQAFCTYMWMLLYIRSDFDSQYGLRVRKWCGPYSYEMKAEKVNGIMNKQLQ